MPIKDLSTEQLLVEMREIHAAMMSASRRAIMESVRLSRFQAELEYRALSPGCSWQWVDGTERR